MRRAERRAVEVERMGAEEESGIVAGGNFAFVVYVIRCKRKT